MNSIIKKLFVSTVAIILIIPVVFTVLGIHTEGVSPTEKDISLNFKRNFPYKVELIELHKLIKQDFFNQQILPEKVIDAGNGWKFVGDDFSDAFSESLGLKTFTNSELNKLKEVLSARKKVTDEIGCKFYLAVGPNKLTIYPEKLGFPKTERNTKMKQVDSICSLIGVSFIDLGKRFEENKSSMRLYHRTDTHWNDYGGFLAQQEIMKKIAADFPNEKFKNYEINDMKIDTTIQPVGDLNGMLMLEKKEDYISFTFKKEPQSTQHPPSLPVRRNYHKDPSFYELRFTSETNDLKVMIINDSFFGYFRRYMKTTFGESIFLWDYVFDPAIVRSERADVLIHEIVERDLDFLISDM